MDRKEATKICVQECGAGDGLHARVSYFLKGYNYRQKELDNLSMSSSKNLKQLHGEIIRELKDEANKVQRTMDSAVFVPGEHHTTLGYVKPAECRGVTFVREYGVRSGADDKLVCYEDQPKEVQEAMDRLNNPS